MAPKPKTKGQKEIERDNKSVVSFWRYVVLSTLVLHALSITWFHLTGSMNFVSFIVFAVSLGVHALAHWIIDKTAISGLDLTINEGTVGYTKDIMIVTIVAQVLSIVSNYFFLLILAIPLYGGYKIWIMLIWPWFTAGSAAPSDDPKSKRKQEKKEKKVFKRIQK